METIQLMCTRLGLNIINIAALTVSWLFWSSYRTIARLFKWLTLVLLALIILLLTRDRKVMGNAANSPLLNGLGWIAFVSMVAAALGLLIAS